MTQLLQSDNHNTNPYTTDKEKGVNLAQLQKVPEHMQLDLSLAAFLTFCSEQQRNLGILLSDSLSCVIASWWDEVPGVQRPCYQKIVTKSRSIKTIVSRGRREMKSKKSSKAKKPKNTRRKSLPVPRITKGSIARKSSSKKIRKATTAIKIPRPKLTDDTESTVLRPQWDFMTNIEEEDFTSQRYICNCSTCKLPTLSIAQPVADMNVEESSGQQGKQKDKAREKAVSGVCLSSSNNADTLL